MADEFLFDSDDFVAFCANFCSIPVEELTDSLIEVNIQDLHDRWINVQRSYKNLCLAKEISEKKDILESARSKYANCTSQFHAAKSKMLDVQKSLIVPGTSGISLASRDNDNYFAHIKVPPCDTDVFNGGYEEWPSFRDMFTAVYGNHPKLSPVQKLYHLRLKVKGKAGLIVKKYQLCDENFSLAWEALRSRYENKRILVDNQLKVLLSLKPISTESSESLQVIQTTINDSLSFLKSQNVPISNWDPIIVYLCSTKLPHETLSLWEQSLKSHKELPTWEDMDSFLSNRYEVVERLNSIQGTKSKDTKKTDLDVHTYSTEGVSQFLCKVCNMNHALKNCSQFRSLDPKARFDIVSKNNVCFNCLSYSHLRKDCTSKFVCSHCKKNHHSLLHIPSNKSVSRTSPTINVNVTSASDVEPTTSQQMAFGANQTNTFHVLDHLNSRENTLLPTAVVQITHNGDTFRARAFLDQGSEKTFVSKSLQQRLRLPTIRKNYTVRGMGGNIVANSNSLCTFTLYSKNHHQYLPVKGIVVPKITRLLPNFVVAQSNYASSDLEDIDLADPDFFRPGNVEILLGSDVLPNIWMEGVKKVGNSLVAQATIFGFVLSGPVMAEMVSAFSIAVSEEVKESGDPLVKLLTKFWEQEEIMDSTQMSKDDEICESLFETTTVRNSEGRFVVRLPFKSEFPNALTLGASRTPALVQYFRMEQSLRSKESLATTYNEVLQEYLTLNHMKPTSSNEIKSRASYHSYYLPHHSVLKPESTSTKLRVVFNASKRTNTGNSLNDILHTGPALQADLMIILLNWRFTKFVFGGDIEKMYRQILIHDDDQHFQRILFRPRATDPVKDFALNTLTFGVNCSPYLAIRTLIKLAHDSSTTHPHASHILQNETYVDDILSGGHDIKSTINALAQLIDLLKSAGFPLKKITSNCREVLESVPNYLHLNSEFLKFSESSSTKTLGIQWNAVSDTFSYQGEAQAPVCSITKKSMLSKVLKIYDPVGWISPITIQGKMLFQHIWLEGTKWDECVKQTTLAKWNKFIIGLPQLAKIQIPRWINYTPCAFTQIHGFCDASEKAYCAVIYLRIQSENSVHSHLFVSKCRLAPIDPVSLPRLELCGAVLLAKLVNKVRSSLHLHKFEVTLWSDSTIVLGWLEKPPCSWKTYVANRTARILREVGNSPWRHVRSADNPADLGSRGCAAADLVNNSLWWHGPPWLVNPPQEWPTSTIVCSNLPETRKVEVFHTFTKEEDVLNRFSDWPKAIRVIAYVFRFYHKISRKLVPLINYEKTDISFAEFRMVKIRLISVTQMTDYCREFESLKMSQTICRKSPLYSLNPFIDNHNIIRADGRIVYSDLTYNERYPIIMPVESKYFQLLLSFAHKLLLHAEHNLMIRTIRQEYYVSRLKSAIKKCIRGCKICTIYKRKVQSQIMAALPSDRSSFSLPFTITGLDFAGPFSTKTSMVRQAPYQKSYVCIFVCFSTKAVHLEICSDLTTGSFLAAFTRFVGRRGLPQKVFSDNGTNFVGAARILSSEYNEFIKCVSKDISDKYVSQGFQWSFIPPNAPHMGGLWEAAVKSFKSHFRKVAQNHKYTFEQFNTLLVRIEAVLNSRPLSPMTDNPQELIALTPGHFLRGAPLVATPELATDNLKLVDRWDKLKLIQHQFARRWKDEYIKELHRRSKWQSPKENVHVGQLVILKEDLLPPCEWKLGRILKIYQGKDGRSRVADIKTQLGTITRPITKLCVLPLEQSQ